MLLRLEERAEPEVGIAQRIRDHFAVEAVAEEHAELRALQAHILDRAERRSLAQGELIAVLPIFAHELGEGIDDKGIVLGRDAEDTAHARGIAEVVALEELCLLDYLPCI